MTNILVVDFVLVFMIFLRISSAFVVAPIFSQQALPATLKIVLALTISYTIFLTINREPNTIQISLFSLVINGLKEVLIGLLLGFMMNFVFYGINYAGTLIGFDMQLTMAEVFNPMDETSSNVIGEVLNYGAILIFLLIDGHHYFIRGLAYSFKIVHIGQFNLSTPAFKLMMQYTAEIFIIAVKIASPIMVSFFLVHIAEGIISRVIPQMQVFFVSQPLKLALGFLMLVSVCPIYVYVIRNLLKGYEDSLFNLIKAMG